MSEADVTSPARSVEIAAFLSAAPDADAQRVRTARRIFYICLSYISAMTALWAALMIFQPQDVPFFRGFKRVTTEELFGFAMFVAVWMIFIGYLFYGLKYWLSKSWLKMNADELKVVFSNRLRGFDLNAILAGRSERNVRVVDMIGRRGRWFPLAALGYLGIYLQIRQEPKPETLMFGVSLIVVDSLIMCWWWLLTFHSNGALGHAAYGAIARTLDGVLGRANALFIGTLWNAFRFVMIPITAGLVTVYAPSTYAALFAFIWLTYIIADYASEIFGSLYGKHFMRVWGIGDMNKKSWEGVAAAFIATLLLTVGIVYANGLPSAWYGLAILLSISNPLVELYSPRATDDFTMATSNALICLAYGKLFF